MNDTKRPPASMAIAPSILYYGTPVILLTTRNEDGSDNISPLSSSWALGDRIVLGVGCAGQGYGNLMRERECVLNVPDASLWRQVELLAPFTGKQPVPEAKRKLGFAYEPDKFGRAGLSAAASERVKPARIADCPLQIEAAVRHIRIPDEAPHFAIVETEALRVHAHADIVRDERHIDPVKWNPLIYNFRHYYGLGPELGRTFRATT
ncbi:flavin reductase family protein [Cohnella nanjingensis]|uniref:Flavin reductase family protein n=1 Tax=Cohnella nanjingensis TaxID=1387779 RepID=A0A7X0VJF4_9BACL|nr:flavin reductase family protein [Cohnella nanjingensis]MBB6674664.1 flavin reductase family protein [Cohnella nanjingensis]